MLNRDFQFGSFTDFFSHFHIIVELFQICA